MNQWQSYFLYLEKSQYKFSIIIPSRDNEDSFLTTSQLHWLLLELLTKLMFLAVQVIVKRLCTKSGDIHSFGLSFLDHQQLNSWIRRCIELQLVMCRGAIW